MFETLYGLLVFPLAIFALCVLVMMLIGELPYIIIDFLDAIEELKEIFGGEDDG